MNLKEMLKKAQENLVAIKAAMEKGEKTADDLQKAIDEVKDLEAKAKKADEAEALIKSLSAPQEKPADSQEPQEKAASSIGENFTRLVKSVKDSGRFDAKNFRVAAPAFKASTDTQVTPATSGVSNWATTFDKNVVEAARTPLVVRDLFGAESISGSTLMYLVEGAIEGSPATTSEASEKNQVHFADPTPVTVSLAKLTCYIKESDEYINDYPFLASAVNGRLLYELGLVEQNKLITDLTSASIQSDTSSWTSSSDAAAIADLILESAMDVQEQSGFAADAIVMNPAVWYTLRVGKDNDDRYYGGGYFGGQNVPNLWGIPVCVTTAVTSSQIIVGAFKTCGSVVSKGGIAVEATNTDQDDFVKNLMTIRAEERLALAVRRPSGFKLLTKAS